MQHKVPQDVQREDTIIGPLTLKQMIILGVGGGLTYATYIGLSKSYFIEIWLLPVAFLALLTLAFAFLKIHSLRFHEFLMHMIEYRLLPHQRTWIQGTGVPFISSFDRIDHKGKKEEQAQKTKKSPKSLAEITKVLDTHGQEASQTNQK